jgi:hypothetical protein
MGCARSYCTRLVAASNTKRLFLPLLCLLLCSCGPDVLIRADHPLTRAEVRSRGELDFPFPESAREIYYAIYADSQPSEYLIRFDAPPAECEATVSRALAWNAAGARIPRDYAPRPFTGRISTSTYLHPVPWFDGSIIQSGLFAGEDSSHAPNIWIDLVAGRFYYRSTD